MLTKRIGGADFVGYRGRSVQTDKRCKPKNKPVTAARADRADRADWMIEMIDPKGADLASC